MYRFLVVLSLAQARPQISLEYKPMRPFYYPNPPGSHISQIVPPGKPWPDSSQGYQNFSQVDTTNRIKDTENSTNGGFEWGGTEIRTQSNIESSTNKASTTSTKVSHDYGSITTPVVVDRIKDSSTETSHEQTVISLEYKPNRPFHYPKPGNTVLQQIIPPEKPWPGNPEGYQNFSKPGSTSLENRNQETTSSTTANPKEQAPISLEYKPNRPTFYPNPGDTLGQIVPPGEPWPANPEGDQNFSQLTPQSLENQIKNTSSTPKKPISLEYQPNRPSFHPNPGDNLGQIVPPGKPWPANSAGYQNFSQTTTPKLENKIKETTTKKPNSSTTKKPISLEYQPNRPSFHPNPGNTLGQIVPEGQPWPSSIEGYQNFSQTSSPPAIIDRQKETTQSTEKIFTSAITQSTPISLEYKPSRPFYYPNPGVTLGQIVPSGEPWPGGPEDYQNFSQTSVVPDTVNRFGLDEKNKNKEEAKPSEGFIWNDEITFMVQDEESTPAAEEKKEEISSTTDSRIYTSTESKIKDKDAPVEVSDYEENEERFVPPRVPLVVVPFSWQPSHYIFYI